MIEGTRDFIGRVWVAGLVSATLGVGGVWFVVDQSLSSLQGHVASIDRRMETFITKREFDQFQERIDGRLQAIGERLDVSDDRFDAFDTNLDRQFERLRSAFERTALSVAPDRQGPFTLLADRIETSDGGIVVDVAGLTDVQVGFLFGRLVERFSTSEPTDIEQVADALRTDGYEVRIINEQTIAVRASG